MLKLALLAFSLAPTHPSEGANTWPQWRGPTRDGLYHGERWPESLDESRLRLRWKVTDLGPSYAGPIVSADRIFTVESSGDFERASAYSRADGELLWTNEWRDSMDVPFFAASRGSWVRSTPAWDGERLYVGGMSDRLVAIDGETGKTVWDVDFEGRYASPEPAFGLVCSPLVDGESIYVQAGGGVVKLDKDTGESRWRSAVADDAMMGSAFSSPVLAQVAGERQLVTLTRSHLTGLDPEGGGVLWDLPVEAFRGMNILTPLVYDGRVFTAPYGGRATMVDVRRTSEGPAATFTWNNRIQGHMTSPVVIDGHAYMFTRANRMSCIRLEDGEVAWTSPPPGESYWSLVADQERVLALSDTGTLRLIAADPKEYRVLSEREVAEDSWAHIAVCSGEVAIRDIGFLALYDWSEPESDEQPE